MKVSTWLVIEMRRRHNYSNYEPVITKARQTRPTNEMAVKVTLDINPDELQPHVEAMVDAGLISLVIEEQAIDSESTGTRERADEAESTITG